MSLCHLLFFLFFFLMIRRPPRSTLFPTRRSSDLRFDGAVYEPGIDRAAEWILGMQSRNGGWASRSEEHTSELQSRVDLVCRLLLEKKKKKKEINIKTDKKTSEHNKTSYAEHSERY